MSLLVYQKNNCTSGELSQRMLGRSDLPQHKNGLQELLNGVSLPYGGVTRRPGTQYIGTLADQTKQSQLTQFEYSSEVSYILEFNDLSIRFYRNKGSILLDRQVTNNTFTGSITGWTDQSSGGGSATYSSNALLLTPGAGTAKAASSVFINSGTNQITVTMDVTTNSITYNVGTTQGGSEIATGSLSAGVGQTFNFTPSTNSDIYLSFSRSTAGNATIDNIVMSTPTYKIDSPYLEADLSKLRFIQSFDTLYILHRSYAPRKLVRYDNASWKLSTVTFDEPAWMDENQTTTTLTPSAVSGSITVTASAALFASTDVGRAIRLKSGEDLSEVLTYSGDATKKNFDITFWPQGQSDVDVYLVSNVGVKTLQTYTTHYTISSNQVVMVTAPASGAFLEIRPKNVGSGEWGWGTITAYGSETSVTVSVDTPFGGTNATLMWRLGAWSTTTGFPKCGTLLGNRLWLASTTSEPNSMWFSALSQFTNFKPDSDLNKGTPSASSAGSFKLTSDKNQEIEWLAGKQTLIIGSSTSVSSLLTRSGEQLSALSPPALRKDIDILCREAEIVTTDTNVVFVNRAGSKMHNISFNLESDSYNQNNLSLLTDHIPGFGKQLTKIVRQEEPFDIVWSIDDSGNLYSTTFNPQQNITSWSRHDVDGIVESFACIPKTGSDSELWLIVKRTVNGNTKRYLEVLSTFFYGGTIFDSRFLDSWAVYDGVQSTTLTLSLATVGTGRTATAGSSVFAIGDIGRRIRTDIGVALITGYTSGTVITVTIESEFESTSIVSDAWWLMATTITGLSHLEGETVGVLCDGRIHNTKVVSSGSITLDSDGGIVVVGLPQTFSVKLMPVELQTQFMQTTKAIKTKVQKIALRLFETVGLSVGINDVFLPIEFNEPQQLMGRYLDLFSGVKRSGLNAGHGLELSIVMKSEDPLPTTILDTTILVGVQDAL